MLRHTNLPSAAKALGLNEKTLRRWLLIPEFQEKYRAAKRELIQGAIHTLLHAAGTATHTLVTIMQDAAQPASARVGAARCVLQMVIESLHQDETEARLMDMETRLAAFEAMGVESNHHGAIA
jgi:hypothetical protein